MANFKNYVFLVTLLAMFCISCQPSKKMHQDRLYLQGIDSSVTSTITIPEPVIQKGEILSITVYSNNADATQQYNQTQNGSASIKSAVGAEGDAGSLAGSGLTAGTGYQVDPEGNIHFFGLGTLHIEGLTKLQLKHQIEAKLDTVLTNPYVEIRFLNKKITVLGEVAKPGIINMPESKISILDAIALSGDITAFGRRDNILVVREENGKRSTARLNAKDPAVYKSDFFYLHKDDLVYIEPSRKKPTGTDQTLVRNISLGASLLSVLAIFLTIFKK